MQGLVITLLWLPAVFLGVDKQGFAFLFFATLISFLTQFPIAYASRRAEHHTLNMMRLLVALAEEIRANQTAQGEQLGQIKALSSNTALVIFHLSSKG